MPRCSALLVVSPPPPLKLHNPQRHPSLPGRPTASLLLPTPHIQATHLQVPLKRVPEPLPLATDTPGPDAELRVKNLFRESIVWHPYYMTIDQPILAAA